MVRRKYAVRAEGSVLVSDKYIQPVNYCKAYEVQLLLVPDFVLGTHEKLS